MKTKKHNIYEIRSLLGKDYHLSQKLSFDENMNPIEEWDLYRFYKDSDVYFSNDNKKIMSSDTNTMEELYEYAKKHHKIDIGLTSCYTMSIIALFLLILGIVNLIFINDEYIRGFVLGGDIVIILHTYIYWRTSNHNWKVDEYEWKEEIRKVFKNEK